MYRTVVVLLAVFLIVSARPQTEDTQSSEPTTPSTVGPKRGGCGGAAADVPEPSTKATTKNPNCGSTQNGQTVDKGKYYYTCDNGDYKPVGCLDNKKQRLPAGQTFEENQYVLQCVLSPTQDLSIEFVACMIGGNKVAPDETAQTDLFFYKCTKMPDGRLQSDVSGCVYQGKRVNLKDRVVQDGYVFECRKEASTNQGIALWPVACYNEADQKNYEVGQEFTGADKNLYACTVDEQTKLITKKILTCQTNSGKKVKNGESFREGDTMFKCFLGTTSATIQLVGCATEKDEVKNVGAVWYVPSDANPSLKYEVQCTSTNNSTTTIVRSGCVFFDANNRQTKIQPGCFVKVDDQHAAGCKAVEPAGLQGFYFDVSKLDVATSNQLALC